MNTLYQFIGEDKYEITLMQMMIRGIVIFFFAVIFLRFSGRRTFGMRSPFDNVISILLGAILSRAVVGVSPFFPIVLTALVIALLHRLIGFICYHYSAFGSLMKGNPKVLYENGEMNKENMKRCQISERDFEEGLRMAGIDDINLVKTAVAERNGSISIVRKDQYKESESAQSHQSSGADGGS